jgi:methylated-DNA-[protein]-cysteine S-methyltransferase
MSTGTTNKNQQEIPKEAHVLLMSGTKNVTAFQLKVYTALCHVPAGKCTTYKEIARVIHCRSQQAVGQALRRNPYAPTVPCHRVVKSNGSIGGFSGCRSGKQIDKKILLLQDEGVQFDEIGSVTKACLYNFD